MLFRSAVFALGICQIVEAGEAYKVLRTFTDPIAPAPINKRANIQCAPTSVGGMAIEGPKIGFYFNSMNGEWCRASHACTKTFDEIAKRSCEERAAVGN